MTSQTHEDAARNAYRARVDEYREIQRFIRRVRREALKAGHLNAYALTFTYPDWAQTDWFFIQAHSLAAAVAECEGEGIWLMADESESKRFHWHAIALSSRPPEWFVEWWARKTGASKDAVKITLVKGQDQRRSTKFKVNLARAILYRCKDAPGLGLALAARAVASGPLRTAWKKAVSTMLRDPYLALHREQPSPPRQQAAAGGSPAPEGTDLRNRVCARPGCGAVIPETKPAHTKYHDARCKARDFRERRRTESRGRPERTDEGEAGLATGKGEG